MTNHKSSSNQRDLPVSLGWEALSSAQIRQRVFEALGRNQSYRHDLLLGLPGSFLDQQVFPPLEELKSKPLLATMMANPNHIGCHTLGGSEPAFAGTHDLEREVISICSTNLLNAEPNSVDGYIASGGTESNIQALWTFRNALNHRGIPASKIAVMCSKDTHYSISKAANLLGLQLFTLEVNDTTRRITEASAHHQAAAARDAGFEWILVVLTMGTTMFGSVDHPSDLLPFLDGAGLHSLVHVDAAFGGFIFPLTEPNHLDFRDPRLISFTLDAHKMLQAPYGTGVHLIRKGWIQHVLSEQASYVPGHDSTLIGSRSGTNAVAVWMILRSYGFQGGQAFCADLMTRTDHLCRGLDKLGVSYYRHAGMNVVTLRDSGLNEEICHRYQLVPDDFDDPKWWKIVVMEHVTTKALDQFLSDLSKLSSPE